MKQILQNLGNGETLLVDIPCPRRPAGAVLCQTSRTLVSLGTEKMLIDFGKAGWIAKARSQPDKVKQVLQKIRTDGLVSTIDAVRSKLDTPIPLGYCHAGTVVEADRESGLATGDRIATNGPHAEMVVVPENLTARIPDQVSDDEAAFTVVGAIGLQGIRLLQPTLGEKVVVSGLGLIGLLTVQMLRAQGCQVLGIDYDESKLELARQFGASVVNLEAGEDPVARAAEWSSGNGVDGVLITASSRSDDVVHQAATMCRKRGRIVLVGVVGLNLQRADFYEKELTFQVSCSYGPGRYEPRYEGQGMDYPIGFVRWTEQRNFQAVLELMADRRLDCRPLITHRFPFDNALDGYAAVNDPNALGIILEYAAASTESVTQRQQVLPASGTSLPESTGSPRIAFVGAGNFATRTLMPSLPTNGLVRETVVSNTGVSAAHAARKFGFREVSTDAAAVFDNPDVDAVFITTPHDSHARLVCDALASGKHVFVEKPLALTGDELDQVEQARAGSPGRCLMVGFNRRFSPHAVRMKQWMGPDNPVATVLITVNAGTIPADHWTQDIGRGGGRIIGEACHFVDLARFLCGSPITSLNALPMGGHAGRLADCVSIQIGFENRSLATVMYLSNGSREFPKERVEVFAGGRVLCCDNFRVSREIGGRRRYKSRGQDKGHRAELAAFARTIRDGGDQPIPAAELFEVSRAAIEADRQIRERLAENGGANPA